LFGKELKTYKRKKLRTRINNLQQQEIKQDIEQKNKPEIKQKQLITQEKEEEIIAKDEEIQKLKEEKESAIEAIKKLAYLHNETVYKFENEIRYLKEQIEYYNIKSQQEGQYQGLRFKKGLFRYILRLLHKSNCTVIDLQIMYQLKEHHYNTSLLVIMKMYLIINKFKRLTFAQFVKFYLYCRLRFDTVLIHNLVFIINLYRSVRMKLQRDLVYSKNIVLRSAPITRVQLTEFYGNQVDHGRQTYKEAYPEMWRRYNY